MFINRKHSQETKEKMRQAALGHKKWPYFVRKVPQENSNLWNKGKILS
jgi:hypothetical protein